MKVHARQVFALDDDHPHTITESHITQGEMLRIIRVDTRYGKSNKNVRNIKTVRQHLADALLVTLGPMGL